jgi:hypothetical protein
MHVPDWDVAFLARYHPRRMAEAVSATGAEAVMLYFQSHLGLCYYPTKIGRRHAAMGTADWAGEALTAFAEKGIPVCAYYSVNFNNQAWLEHPDWRLQPAAPVNFGILPRERYGVVCLNNREYRDFVDGQIDEITAYGIDALFFDMVWWNGVCICPACQARYAEESGNCIPRIVDWNTAVWTDFQHARERWLTDFARSLRERARRARRGIDVYHNFALALSNWTRGVSFDSVAGHDFLGGDFYGGRAEQLLITRLMLNLTPSRPAEFMTTAATDLTEHTRLRPRGLIETKALAAVAANAAFLAIVAIDPEGTLDSETMNRVRLAFDGNRTLDGLVGGEPIESVAIYCSDTSKCNVWEGARPLAEAPPPGQGPYPHFTAISGAARALQEAHIPFGVATSVNRHELARWPVIVLPNAERLSDMEIEALRRYVEGGGCLYASRGASLWNAAGGRRADFGLADLFGCHFEGLEEGRLVYVEGTALSGSFRPLAHWLDSFGKTGCLRINVDDATTLARLTLSYGHPYGGTVSDRHWASIHSSPPWQQTDRSLVIERAHGMGRVIYSACDLEAGDSPEHREMFIHLVERLLAGRATVRADVHPQVWLSAFRQPGRIVVLLLNYPLEEPSLPIPNARITLNLRPEYSCSRVWIAPAGEQLVFRQHSSVVEIECPAFQRLAAIIVEHETLA